MMVHVNTSNFSFLHNAFPELAATGQLAEKYLFSDPNASLFKLRLFGETIVNHIWKIEDLEQLDDNSQFNRIKHLDQNGYLSYDIKTILHEIRKLGNVSAHSVAGAQRDAQVALSRAFKLGVWFYEVYNQGTEHIDTLSLTYNQPQPEPDTAQQLSELENKLKQLQEENNELLTQLQKSFAEQTQEQKKERKEKAISISKKLKWSEAETRTLIDEQLRLAGWEADTDTINFKKNRTVPQRGKKQAIAEWPLGGKWADYALFNGLELYAIVEAKKYSEDISTNLDQSKIYAELAEASHKAKLLGQWGKYKVPFLYSTNGRPYLEQIKTKSGIWFLDVRKESNISRPLQGWYSPEGLEKLLQQDIAEANEKLATTPLDFLMDKSRLGLREYQIKAIKAVEQKLIQQPEERKALIAMATGTGKTRTIIGLCYHLIQTNRFSRILFLVDRTLLGIQALNAFKDNKVVDLNTFADVYDVKALKDLQPDVTTRLHFATVQSLVKRLFYNETDENLPPVDQYDCIIIDEAHRGYLLDKEQDEMELETKNQQDYISKYRMVLDYFDAYAIGLTATPALHTKQIFGPAVYTYSYREAVIDGFLIDHDPPYIIKTKLSEEGISWKQGEKPKVYDQESNSIVELENMEDEIHIDVAGFNKKVITENFNRTVIKQLVKELDPNGDEKTLVFAATDSHADMVVSMLKEEFQELGIDIPDNAVQKITGNSYDPAEQVKRFKNEKYPNIAVTVDLLTTGIDVPAICNIVFLRKVKSRILYEQMLGRATRRCDEIQKETFKIYDAVRLYETLQDYTQMKPVVVDPKTTFAKLAAELESIDTNEHAQKQLDQIIAKLQRKKQKMNDHQHEQFSYKAGGTDTDSFIQNLKDQPLQTSIQNVVRWSGLWEFLDEMKPTPAGTFVSEHTDSYITTERGYGRGQKPEDYLESFERYIRENQNKITALNIICTNPKELDRKSLKDLYLELGLQGFDHKSLNSAWKDAKKQEIAADIISFIRSLTMGITLESPEERIKRAVSKVRAMRPWNKIQQNWIDRFEKQLLAETVLQVEDLNREPFKDAGGFQKLDKVFENQLTEVINTINDNLYTQIA